MIATWPVGWYNLFYSVQLHTQDLNIIYHWGYSWCNREWFYMAPCLALFIEIELNFKWNFSSFTTLSTIIWIWNIEKYTFMKVKYFNFEFYCLIFFSWLTKFNLQLAPGNSNSLQGENCWNINSWGCRCGGRRWVFYWNVNICVVTPEQVWWR